MENCHLTKNEINIKKNYIKTYEDFEKTVCDTYNKSLDEIENVESLSIVKNYISSPELSKIFLKFSNSFLFMKYLNLTANDLTEIPIEFNVLSNLQILILNNNKINKIENLNHLQSLERLELRSNRITKLENIGNLSNLKLLTVSCNLITIIKNEDLGSWKEMIEFCIFGNFLGCEDDSIKNNESLINLLTTIEIKLPKLKKIYLGGNHFSKLNDFKNLVKNYLPKLDYLDGTPI